jgi:hypothetical protein
MKLKRQEPLLLIATKACASTHCFLQRQHHGIYQVIDNWLMKGCHYHYLTAWDMQITFSQCDYHQDNLVLGEPVKCQQQLIIILHSQSAGGECISKTYDGYVCGAGMICRTHHLGTSDNPSVLPKHEFPGFWRKASNGCNCLMHLLQRRAAFICAQRAVQLIQIIFSQARRYLCVKLHEFLLVDANNVNKVIRNSRQSAQLVIEIREIYGIMHQILSMKIAILS